MSIFGEVDRRQRLGKALRELRRDAGLTGVQLAGRLHIAQSSVSRIEAGRQVLTPEQIRQWANATGASADQLDQLDQLAEAAATEAVAWGKRSLVSMQRDTADAEASSGLVRGYHPLMVHTLLQTPDYARAAYQTRARIFGQSEAEIAKAIAKRMDKQALLHIEGHRFEFLMAEAGLRWRFVDTDVMAAQLDRIAQVAKMPNVLVGILPMDRPAPAWRWAGFAAFLERTDGDDLVLVEDLTSGTTVRDPADLDRYAEAWARLLELAVTGEAAAVLLERLATDLRSGP
jgi:transcriptional regulator with XRE-family HTH domain